MKRYLVPLIALSAVAGCNDEPAPVAQGGDDRAALGEVQEGSISDAMLPLDSVQSVSPPVRNSSGGSTERAAGASDGEADAAASSREPAESEQSESAPADENSEADSE
ncbi:hypothetical protein [Pontixanthobacter luteolus]|uniref:hypothetical protein n=1 Tax=Pontixanthobacter luteolus TaxID=295089 RepID=UPI0023031822|nr:hypothetical protein [Pontixanthobacter luteolus]